MTVDYKNQCIVIDGPEIDGEELPMEQDSVIGLYTIQVSINGINQKAIVDTGSQQVVLRKDYDKENSEIENLEKFCLDESIKVELKKDLGRKVNIKYGNSTQKIKAYMYYNNKAEMSDMARKLVMSLNTFGYSVYKDKIIQFDLENMVFRIK